MIAAAPESEQRLQAGVGFGLGALAAGHAEGADLGPLQAQRADPLKVLKILLVRGGIAALDVIEPDAVEPLGQRELVLEREADALALGAVAERGVVDFDASHEERGQGLGVRGAGVGV